MAGSFGALGTHLTCGRLLLWLAEVRGARCLTASCLPPAAGYTMCGSKCIDPTKQCCVSDASVGVKCSTGFVCKSDGGVCTSGSCTAPTSSTCGTAATGYVCYNPATQVSQRVRALRDAPRSTCRQVAARVRCITLAQDATRSQACMRSPSSPAVLRRQLQKHCGITNQWWLLRRRPLRHHLLSPRHHHLRDHHR